MVRMAGSWTVRQVERLLDEAAVAEIVVLTDTGSFTRDLDLLRSIADPASEFTEGPVPNKAGVVSVHLAEPRTVYLSSVTESGKGLYVKANFTPGGVPQRHYARSEQAGSAPPQMYEAAWPRTRPRS
jgi:hypothetical protein